MRLKSYMVVSSAGYALAISLAFFAVWLSRRPDGWETLYPPALVLAVVLAYASGIYGESRKSKAVRDE